VWLRDWMTLHASCIVALRPSIHRSAWLSNRVERSLIRIRALGGMFQLLHPTIPQCDTLPHRLPYYCVNLVVAYTRSPACSFPPTQRGTLHHWFGFTPWNPNLSPRSLDISLPRCVQTLAGRGFGEFRMHCLLYVSLCLPFSLSTSTEYERV